MKPKLIAILSNGRSGSTLLDLLLNTHPAVWTMGEIQLLPYLVRDPDARCGCGSVLADCEFWGPILDRREIARPDFPVEYFRNTRGAGKALRPRELPGLLFGLDTPRLRDRAVRYGQANRDLIELVRERSADMLGTRPTWMVDASKDVYRFHYLAQSDAFDLRAIHILKDPRAFACSALSSEHARPRRRVARMSARWLVQNHLYRRAQARDTPGRALTITYEELAAQPQSALDRIVRFLELDGSGDADRIRNVENHAIAGSPMRWNSDDIRLDDRWRRELAPGLARLSWQIAGRSARSYGYTRQPNPVEVG